MNSLLEQFAATTAEPDAAGQNTAARPAAGPRIELNAENAAKGLGRLAVAIVNLLHELLERQAIRRMDNGTLTAVQIEQLGECLMQQSLAIDQLCTTFALPATISTWIWDRSANCFKDIAIWQLDIQRIER